MTSAHRRVASSLAIMTACFVALAGLEIASAHSFNAKTTVMMSSLDIDGAAGPLRSKRDDCKPGRKVKLYRQRQGKDDLIGWAFSNSEGRWELVTDLALGRYYVVVTRSVDNSGSHEHICSRDTSRTRTLS